MTRPGGVTPRGLPFPGSANIHAETPKAIQSLAEAIGTQLSSIAGGLTLQFFSGNVALNSTAGGTLNFPGWRVYGAFIQLTSHLGGDGGVGFVTGGGSGGAFTVQSVNGAVKLTGPQNFNNKTVGICAVAWCAPV